MNGIFAGAGLGEDIGSRQAEILANQLKACANPKLVKAGYQPVAAGVPGPQTCWLANMVYSDGCPGKAEVAAFCRAFGKGSAAPPKAAPSVATALTQTITDIVKATSIAPVTGVFPWNSFSESTRALQAAANRINAERVKQGLQVTYCRLNEDGKLGPGTCGVLRNTPGAQVPPSCQSFSTTCAGEMVNAAGVVVGGAKPITTIGPTAKEPEMAPPMEESWIDRIGGIQNLIIGGAVLAAIGVVGYAVAKKKGWIGKKPRPNLNRPKLKKLSGEKEQRLLEDAMHLGMALAEESLRAREGVSARMRQAWWEGSEDYLYERLDRMLGRGQAQRVQKRRSQLRSALKQAFNAGWNMRASRRGYQPNTKELARFLTKGLKRRKGSEEQKAEAVLMAVRERARTELRPVKRNRRAA